jgi:O-antigen ligase
VSRPWPASALGGAAGPAGARALSAGAAAVAAALVGALVAREPRFLHLGVTFDLRTSVALVAGLGLASLILLHPGFGLGLLCAFVYLNLSEVLVRHHQVPSLLQLLAVPLFLTAWLRRRGDLPRALVRPLTLALGVYTLVLIVSTVLARDTALADERVEDDVKALAVYLLIVLLASSLPRIRRGVWTLLASGSLLGAVVLAQALTGDFRNEYLGLGRIKYAHIYGEVFEPRLAGPLGDPNFFAQALVILVPLALVMAAEERRALTRAAALAAGGLVTAAVVLTYSRGGAVALGCVLALSLLARSARLKHLAVAATLLVLLAALLPAAFARRLETIVQVLPGQEEVLRPDSSFEQRRLLTRVAWRIFLDHPLLGVGAGNYTLYFDDYAQEVGSLSREYEELGEQHYPHNLYLEIAAETGLVGLAAFGAALAACFTALRSARAASLERGDAAAAALARGFEIAVAGYLVSSLFLHGHHIRYLWLLFAFATALERACASLPPRQAAVLDHA